MYAVLQNIREYYRILKNKLKIRNTYTSIIVYEYSNVYFFRYISIPVYIKYINYISFLF